MASMATSPYLPPLDVPHVAQGAIEDHVVVRELTRRIADVSGRVWLLRIQLVERP